MVNKFLLAGDNFMSEMHFRQPEFTCSACRAFIKNKERIQKFKETGEQDIHDISIKTNKIKLVFNMTWLIEILKI